MVDTQQQYKEPSQKATDAILFRDRLLAKQSPSRSMWQSISDLIFPQSYGITTRRSDGQELMNQIFDTTGIEELENMASGIASNLFPAGQRFFEHKPPLQSRDDQEAKDYLYYLTEVQHELMFNSNYVAQTGNTIQYWAGFGTGVNYSDWSVKGGLSYRDYAIGTYQCAENSKGIVDTTVFTMPMTARQIQQEFGAGGGSLGASVDQALSPSNNSPYDEFNVVWVVRPRTDRQPDMIDNMNMPWESLYVNEKDKVVLSEGGFDEFPFAVPRYNVLYREVYGRGRGTMMLPTVRVLNRLAKDFLEASNKAVNPALEVHDSFEGQVDVSPGQKNYVQQMGNVQQMKIDATNAAIIGEKALTLYQKKVQDGFYKNAFEPISSLTGDRRNTTEIVERLREGLKKATRPFGRLFIELVTPQITRSAALLIRNNVVEQPPASLQGKPMKIRLINPLALALEDQQSQGGRQWVAAVGEANELFPGVVDNINFDQWARNLGESLGVASDEIRPIDERDVIRQQKAEALAQQEQLAMLQAGADAYGKTTKAPEEGSVAGQLGG